MLHLIDAHRGSYEDDYYQDEDEEIERTLNENIECTSDDELTFMKESYVQILDKPEKVLSKKKYYRCR